MDYKADKRNANLLDCLKEKTDCLYLSNLFYAVSFHVIAVALEEMEAEKYSLEDWNQAVQYLLRKEMSFASVEEAKSFLIAYGKDKEVPAAEMIK